MATKFITILVLLTANMIFSDACGKGQSKPPPFTENAILKPQGCKCECPKPVPCSINNGFGYNRALNPDYSHRESVQYSRFGHNQPSPQYQYPSYPSYNNGPQYKNYQGHPGYPAQNQRYPSGAPVLSPFVAIKEEEKPKEFQITKQIPTTTTRTSLGFGFEVIGYHHNRTEEGQSVQTITKETW